MSVTHTIAWQGWSIAVPIDWNPVKIDGDHAAGTLLLADLHAARLGLRWTTPQRRVNPAEAVDRGLRDELGRLAAAEAVAVAADDWATAKRYADPAPPGRDVFVGHSDRSGRLLTVVYHAAERSGRLAELLTTLADTPADATTAWSVFGLSFATPPGTRVRAERLNAGDLAFLLAGPKRTTTVLRQISPATLALSRRPLVDWTRRMPFTTPKFYRDESVSDETTIELNGHRYAGLRRSERRRRRLWWAWFIPARQAVFAVHDAARDRLLIAQGEDEVALAALLASAVHS